LMCMSDDVELFTAILGSMYLGAIAVPCSTMLTGSELGKLVHDSRARVVLATGEFTANAGIAVADASDARQLIVTGEPPDIPLDAVEVYRWAELLRQGDSGDAATEPYPT